MQAVVIVLIS